ncbi:hypothetical protein LTR56_020842 [Elasticomyces elasticus]|nr:hypothetical protein LTR56_020842 [Elasticomyces elasticus]KAK3652256.1 hypothetical protein LTR22_011758 [Elasticomyces elasticus]KAK4909948.1 hypothetical protein LTR49_021354 [Elasticomyces elasticus]KAK5751593.1 hypothetical protein LTS12_018297 [Elasticomyces elasticus]
MSSKRKAHEYTGATPRHVNSMGPLQELIRKGTFDQFKDVLRTATFDLSKSDALAVLLSMSCHRGRLDFVEHLLSSGADPNAAVKGRPLVPLVQAVEACQPPVAQALTVAKARQGEPPQIRTKTASASNTTMSADQQSAADQERLARLESERLKQEQAKAERLALDRQKAEREYDDRIGIVKLLLMRGAKVNVIDVRGRTPLMIAKTKAVAQHLLDKGADVSVQDQDGMSALMHSRNPELAELLIDRGAEIEAKDRHHRTALMLSVIDDDPAVACLLIDRKADLEAADGMGRTVLVTAVWKNRLVVVKRLLASGVNISRKDARGRNVLHHYAGDSDRRLEPEDGDGPKIFRMLLEKAEDGDVKMRDLKQRCPLHWACATGNLSAAKALLQRPGTEVSPVERKRKTPLHLLVRLAPSLNDGEGTKDQRSETGSVADTFNDANMSQRQQETMRRQQKIREKAREEESRRRTELLRRINECVALLVAYKSDINAESEGGWTPYHVACQEQSDVAIIGQLLASGANRNQRTHTGRTGFHIACEAGNRKIVKHLLAESSIDINTRDNLGNSPLLAAAAGGHKDIVNLLAPWSERQLRDLSKDAKGAAEQFYATVVDFGGYKRGNEVRKVKIYDLLHTDPNIPSLNSCSTVCKGSTVFRWIHLPANNVSWCRDLLTKRFIEEGAEDGHAFKALQRSFLHQHGGKKWHSNYMRTGCQAIPRSTELTATRQDQTPRLSVNFSPQSPTSSHFSGDGAASEDSKSLARATDDATISNLVPVPGLRRSDTGLSTTAGALEVPEDTRDGVRQQRPRALSFSQAPARAHEQVTNGGSNLPAGKDRLGYSRRVVINQVEPAIEHNVFMFAPYLHFETDVQRREMQEVARRATGDLDEKQVKFGDHFIHRTTPDEQLIRAFLKPPISGLHVRRTLDQSFYRTIDTDFRDKTQVVYRYAQKHGDSQEALKVLMVDQLWMWIVNKDLLITSFPQRWHQPRDDPLNVLESTIEEINSNVADSPANLYDLAVLIGGRCFGTFDRSNITSDGLRFLDMFESSIGVAMDKETHLFGSFRDASQQISLDPQKRQQSLQRLERAQRLEKVSAVKGEEDIVWESSHDVRQYSHLKESAIETLLDIGSETELLSEVKDIRDELDMVKMVFAQQQEALSQAHDAMEMVLGTADDPHLQAGTEVERRKITKRLDQNSRAVEHSVKEIDRMDRQAERIYKSMRDLLDLKQKYANAIEARYSRIQAEATARQAKETALQGQETARQGQTLMVFTIATVIFLPLSFIASFFDLDINEFSRTGPEQGMSLSYAAKYIFGIGLSFAVLCILFALGWSSLGPIADTIRYRLFPRGAVAHETKAELEALRELSHREHHTVAQQKAEIAGLVVGAARSRSWKRYAANRRPSLDEHFVGYQV